MPKDQHGEMLGLRRSLHLTKVFLLTKTTLAAVLDGFDAAGAQLFHVT